MSPTQLSLIDVEEHAAIVRGQRQAIAVQTVQKECTDRAVKPSAPLRESTYFDLSSPVRSHRCLGCGADYFNRLDEGLLGYCSDTCQQFYRDWMGNKVTEHTPRLMKYKWVMSMGALQ